MAQESSLTKIPQVDVNLELDDPPTLEGIKEATMVLRVGESPGIDGIPADVYQYDGKAVLHKLHDQFTTTVGERDPTAGPQGGSHCLSPPKHGENADCPNYRCITILSIAGKVLARVLLNRLIPTIAQKITPES